MRKISVGIVAYNTDAKILERTLASVRASDTPLDVYVLCNSPDAHYQDQTERLCGQHGAMVLKNRANRGFGAAHNEIAKSLTDGWYVCCNPDIEVEKDSI